MNESAQKIQALLFVAGEVVPKKDLQQLTGLSLAAIDEAIGEIRTYLEGQGLTLVETSEGVQITTAPSVGEFLGKFLEKEESQLSRAACETLALIAYRGPISRYDIEAIRGVDSRRMLQQLVYRGLITKQASEGRVSLYDVSMEFWHHLGVRSREDLPRFEELKNNEALRVLLASQER